MVVCSVASLPFSLNGFFKNPRNFDQENCRRDFAGGRFLTPANTRAGGFPLFAFRSSISFNVPITEKISYSVLPFHLLRQELLEECIGFGFQTGERKDINITRRNCSDEGIIAGNRISFHRMIFGRDFCDAISHQFNVSSTPHVVISGFWVGPDIEDGWGFVAAFVHRI